MSAFTEANRKAFNDLSSNYDTKPWQKAISQQVTAAVQARKAWLGVNFLRTDERHGGVREGVRQVRLLDYACGTGCITRALGADVSCVRGIDVSENMVAAYNDAVRAAGLSADKARAVVGDLCAADANAIPDELARPEFSEFDLAVVALGFHHFEDPGRAVKRLAARLKAGSGTLCIIDFLPKWQEDILNGTASGSSPDAGHGHGHSHDHQHSHEHDHSHGSTASDFPNMQHTIKHDGFTNAEMDKFFTDAGLIDVKFDVLADPAVMEFSNGTRHRRIFLARARRPETVLNRLWNWVGNIQDTIGPQVSTQPIHGVDGGTSMFKADVPRK